MVGRQGSTIVVTSGQTGVGKTMVTANLGLALAQRGARVCLIDCDPGLLNLDVVLGLDQRIIFDLVDVAQNRCRLQQALIHDRRQPLLYFLPASQRCDKGALTPADMRSIVGSLKDCFDFILIDAPAGFDEGFQTAIAAADRALLVVNPESRSVRDTDRLLELLAANQLREVQLIVNRVRPGDTARHDTISAADVEELLGVPALANVPDDPAVILSTNRGEPLVFDRHGRLSRLFDQLAAAVAGPHEAAGSGGLLSRLRGLFV